MCDDTTTKLCDNLAAQAIELAMAEQREATIQAALALPEADRKRLRRLLDEQFAPELEFDFAPVYPESEWPADVTTTGTTIWPSPRGRA